MSTRLKRGKSEEEENYKKQRSSELPINLFSGLSMRSSNTNDLVIDTTSDDYYMPEISKLRLIKKSPIVGGKIILQYPNLGISPQLYFDYLKIVSGFKYGFESNYVDREITQLLKIHDFFNETKKWESIQDLLYPEHFAKFLDKTDYIYRHPSDRFYLIYLSLYSKLADLYKITVRDLELKLSGNYRDFPIYEIKDMVQVDFPYPSSLVLRGKSITVENYLSTYDDDSLTYRRIDYKLGVQNYHTSVRSKKHKDIPELYRKLTNISGVAICGGAVNNIFYANGMNLDTDIFIYGEFDLTNTISKILEVFFSLKDIDLVIRHGKNCIEIEVLTNEYLDFEKYSMRFSHGDFLQVYKFQIIKRKYSDLKEILLGFDLDSSCVALAKLNNDIEPKVYITDRYMFSVIYGINLINPFRQSESYTYRLLKYIRKGFVPFLPGKLHLMNEKLQNIPWSLEYNIHTVSELIASNFEKIERIKKYSDYVDEKILYIDEFYLPRKENDNERSINTIYEMYKNSSLTPTDENVIDNLLDELGPDFSIYRKNEEEMEEEEGDEEEGEYSGELGVRRGREMRRDLGDLGDFGMRGDSGILGEEEEEENREHKVPTSDIIFSKNPKLALKILKKVGALDNWLIAEPGTQITASFKPTKYDYLAG